MNPIEIFRAGTHTDSHGATLSFSESDLAATARAYDPAVSEAPIVVGHPKADAPAYGWIKSLSAEGGRLFATPDQVDPSFAEMVRAGATRNFPPACTRRTAPPTPAPGRGICGMWAFWARSLPRSRGLRP